jgi:hypothetical protein
MSEASPSQAVLLKVIERAKRELGDPQRPGETQRVMKRRKRRAARQLELIKSVMASWLSNSPDAQVFQIKESEIIMAPVKKRRPRRKPAKILDGAKADER